MFRYHYHHHARAGNGGGCWLLFGILLVIGACIQTPILILPTILILGLGTWAKLYTDAHK